MDAQALGRYLRESREARELTLQDAESALKIRQRILESFEMGQFDLPELSVVQVRGFIRNYARYLQLDEDKVLGYYEVAKHEAQNPPPRRQRRQNKKNQEAKRSTDEILAAPRAITDTDPALPAIPQETFITMGEASELRRRRRWNTLNRVVLVLVSLAALSIVVFVSYQLIQRPASALNIEALPDIIVTDTPTPTYTPLPTSTPLVQAIAPTERVHLTQVYTGQGVMVSILMEQRTWLRVVADGEERFVGAAPPGAQVTVGVNEFIQEVQVTATNASALLVTYNGEAQPALGRRGQRVDVVFTADRIDVSSGLTFEPTSPFTPTVPPTSAVDVGALIAAQTPTDTPGPSPTPTLTFTPSNTPAPTDTPTVTPTASMTPTITPTEGPSPTPTLTPTFTLTPTVTNTPVPTLTPTPTAILPLRATPVDITPTKDGA